MGKPPATEAEIQAVELAQGKVISGTSRWEGIVSKWYGWARKGDRYKEGGPRWFRWQACRDAARLARELDYPPRPPRQHPPQRLKAA